MLIFELSALLLPFLSRCAVMSSLEIKFGLNASDRFDVFHDGELEVLEAVKDRQNTTFTRGILTGWSFALLRSVVRETRNVRLMLLRPGGDEPFELNHFDFYAKGDADVVRKVNNAKEANELWKQRKKIDWSSST